MKAVFESPKLELCEFVVAARLNGSGNGSAHSGAPQSPCSKVPSNGSNSCALPSLPNSSVGNVTCAD
jgi:hypothetical protein